MTLMRGWNDLNTGNLSQRQDYENSFLSKKKTVPINKLNQVSDNNSQAPSASDNNGAMISPKFESKLEKAAKNMKIGMAVQILIGKNENIDKSNNFIEIEDLDRPVTVQSPRERKQIRKIYNLSQPKIKIRKPMKKNVVKSKPETPDKSASSLVPKNLNDE